MRCCCCNVRLKNFEACIKSETTGYYWDMCKRCLDDSGVSYSGKDEDDYEEEDDDFFPEFGHDDSTEDE